MSTQNQSRVENAKRNIIFSILQKNVSVLLNFAVRTIFIYQLNELYLGLNSLFVSVLQILSLAELGFGEAIVFSMYKPLAKGDTAEVCALLQLYQRIYRIIGFCICGIGILLMPTLPYIVHDELPNGANLYLLYLINLFNVVVSYFLFAYKEALLTASQRMDVLSRIGMLQSVVLAVCQIAVLLCLRNYYLYCSLTPVFSVMRNLIVNRVTLRIYPQYQCRGEITRERSTDIKKRVAGTFIYKLCNVFRNSFDSIILSAFLGLTVLAKYNNYFYILSLVANFITIFQQSILAGVGNSMVLEDQEKNYRDFKKMQLLYLWLAGVCTTCFCGLYQPFIRIWVGESYLLSNGTMLIFCAYFFVLRIGDMCYTYRQAAGLFWEDRYRPLVESVVNLTLNILLVKWIGVAGVLLSTIFCLVFINIVWGAVVLFRYYFTRYSLVEYLLRVLFYSTATVIACGLAAIFCSFLPVEGRDVHSLIFFCLRGVICVLVSGTVLAGSCCLLPEHKDAGQFVRRIIGK